MSISEARSLHSIENQEVKAALGYIPEVYGKASSSWFDVFTVEKSLRRF